MALRDYFCSWPPSIDGETEVHEKEALVLVSSGSLWLRSRGVHAAAWPGLFPLPWDPSHMRQL